LYSQELEPSSSEKINAITKDTINTFSKDTISNPSIDSLSIKPTDSIVEPEEMIEDLIEHTADSLIKQDVKNNKVILYDNAHVKYKDIDLQAGYIEIDNNKSLIIAKGIKDSVGEYSQLPIFKQGSEESTQDSIRFNFDTEKAKIYSLVTESQGMNILGEKAKKYSDSIIFIENIKLTSSPKKNPDYYIAVKKAKFIADSKLVAGTSQLVIADVPTPIVLPFAYIPLTEGRASGFLMPTWGENKEQGFFLQNGGYYFVLSDNFDLAVLGDIYTNGSYGIRAESGYAKRYNYSGRFNVSYENLTNGLKGFDDYSKSTNYNIRWTHSQDQKSSPNSRFSASVNLGSSQYFRESINENNNNNFLNNTMSSSVSYYRNFVGTPFNFSASATHSQNTNTEEIQMSLPSFMLNMDRIYPFKGKSGAKNNALTKTGLTYSMKAENKLTATDDTFLKKGMFDNSKNGIAHAATLNTNMKAFKNFTISPNVNYKEIWYFDRINKSYDTISDAVVTDTISQFSTFREYSAGASLATTFYGMFKFKKGKLEAIRHTVRPSLSYSYKPDFSDYNEEYQQSADPEDIGEYSPFQGGIYGTPSSGISNSLGIVLNNVFEAKLRPKDSTETESKKLMLLNNLNFSTNYNMAADSMKWQPVRMNAGTSILNNKMSINFQAALDPYALDANNQRINVANINNGGSLFRLTNAGLTLNYSLSSKEGAKKETDADKNRQANNSDGIFGEDLNVSNAGKSITGNSGDSAKSVELYKARFPWSLKLAYSLTYTNTQRQNEFSNNSLMFSGDVELTPKWSVGASSGYDFKGEGFTYTQLRFSRDLDSWILNFNWVPFGDRQTYYFFLGIKSPMLSDLKYDQRQIPDKRIF